MKQEQQLFQLARLFQHVRRLRRGRKVYEFGRHLGEKVSQGSQDRQDPLLVNLRSRPSRVRRQSSRSCPDIRSRDVVLLQHGHRGHTAQPIDRHHERQHQHCAQEQHRCVEVPEDCGKSPDLPTKPNWVSGLRVP